MNDLTVNSSAPALPGQWDEYADDKPREECGVFGMYSARPIDLAWMTYLGIFSMQHRGQEAAGICVSDGEKFHVEKDLGLVTQVFDERRLDNLRPCRHRTCALQHHRVKSALQRPAADHPHQQGHLRIGSQRQLRERPRGARRDADGGRAICHHQ